MGACRYRDGDKPGSGVALGFISSDIVVENSGTLVLTYTTGDCTNGNGLVHVHFLCGESVVRKSVNYSKFLIEVCAPNTCVVCGYKLLVQFKFFFPFDLNMYHQF